MNHELYNKKEDIINWLEEYNIKNFQLIENSQYGFVVDVLDNVNIYGQKIKEIRVKFNFIKGEFDISGNQLTSLYGSPVQCRGVFDCSRNQLTDLMHCPEAAGIICRANLLTTLKGAPQRVEGYFVCDNNYLINLIGGPQYVQRSYICNYNLLESLEGAPKLIKGNFECLNNNLKSLQNVPERVLGSLGININQLEQLDYLPAYVGCGISLYGNPCAKIYGENITLDTALIVRQKILLQEAVQERESFKTNKI